MGTVPSSAVPLLTFLCHPVPPPLQLCAERAYHAVPLVTSPCYMMPCRAAPRVSPHLSVLSAPTMMGTSVKGRPAIVRTM